MKLLADSCVWSLALRRRPSAPLSKQETATVAELRESIDGGYLALIGPVRQEILSGIPDAAQFVRLKSVLPAFPDQPLTTPVYELAARFFNLCRARGLQAGPVDIQLCAAASLNGWSILTLDQGLLNAISLLRDEGEKL